MNNLSSSIDNGIPVDIVYIDLEKTFDRVQSNTLLDKLDAHGLRGNLLRWLTSFLSDRRQRVKFTNDILIG